MSSEDKASTLEEKYDEALRLIRDLTVNSSLGYCTYCKANIWGNQGSITDFDQKLYHPICLIIKQSKEREDALQARVKELETEIQGIWEDAAGESI